MVHAASAPWGLAGDLAHAIRGTLRKVSHAPKIALVVAALLAGCGSPPPVVAPPAPVPAETASHQMIGAKAEGTPKELFARGQAALMAQHWEEARDVFDALIGGEPDGPLAAQSMLGLGAALEGLGDREKARDTYRSLDRRFPNDPAAREALTREASIDAHLEDWPALGDVGARILARKDATDFERVLGHGARGLSRIEAGDDTMASRDVQDGLDIVERTGMGTAGRLPPPVAQLRFALGEIRRVRSERVSFQPVTPDFLIKIELRCQGLLDAQNAYADAIRSTDPHWAMMSGFRVGEMYRVLHKDLMSIPPTEQAKTEKDKQLFYAIMHVRYRAFVDKGIEMMRRTIELGEKTPESQAWLTRAKAAKKDMEDALALEKAEFAKFPFTEAEVERAIAIMKENLAKKASAK
jgi:tetratricopeptide (TPR) repeat protein